MRSGEIRQGCAATLTDKIEIQDVRTKTETFTDVTGKSRTEIACAGAYDKSIDVVVFDFCIGQSSFRGLGCEERGVFGISGVENVGRNLKRFIDTVESKMPGYDPIVAGEHFFDNGAGTGIELTAQLGSREHVPTFLLRKAMLWRGGSNSDDEHSAR